METHRAGDPVKGPGIATCCDM